MFLNVLFIISALTVLLSCVFMLVTKNIMHACIYLLGALIGVAGLYITLGADFVAATQLVVYVGGVVILMVFAVMLTGGKDFKSKAQALLGLAPAMGNKWTYGLGLFTALVMVLSSYKIVAKYFSKTAVQNMPFTSTVEEIGKLLISDHILAFELSSILLLGALIGAAIIARPNKGS